MAGDLQDAVRDLVGELSQHVPGRLSDDLAVLLPGVFWSRWTASPTTSDGLGRQGGA